ncbi:MAG: glyoxylate/hydroxypyruvate reductase A [Pseudomonadota bacterium]
MSLLVVGSQRVPLFVAGLRALQPDIALQVWPDEVPDPDAVRHALAWGAPDGVLAGFQNLKLMVSVGAGVDHLLKDPHLPDVPLVRFVDPDLTQRMTSYIALQCLYHHRRMCEFATAQRAGRWEHLVEPNAPDVTVSVLGTGVLGQAALTALRGLGYRLQGWSRTPKSLAGVTTFDGADGLDACLATTDILVCLLPLTPATRGMLNADLFAKLKRNGALPGPVLINAGRGGLQVETDILAALQDGTLYAASLDVFENEPLPSASPLWAHERVVITPHCAAESDPNAIAAYTLRQIAAFEAGEPLDHLVDRTRGY